MSHVDARCRNEGVKLAAWEVRSQDYNFKELAGEHHKGCGVRFNLIQRRESHQKRRQEEGQIECLT